MTFEHPDLLLWGPAAALLLSVALTLQWRRLSRLGTELGDVGADRLVPRRLQHFPNGRMLCLVLASLALGTAAAGLRSASPAPSEPPPPLDLAVAVDVSLSMGARDVDATRIERAREVVTRLSESLSSARIVLILFADWPYTLVPPTDDPAVVRYFAHSLSADLVRDRDQGTSLTGVVEHARAALDARPRPDARRVILLLSDGAAHEDPAAVIGAAAAVARDGVPIWTAGVGTLDGAPVTGPAGTLVDDAGRAVTARLDESLLREVARAGDGEYHDVSGDRGVRDLLVGLGALGEDARTDDDSAPGAAFWLTLLAVPALLVEGALDAGHRLRGRERRGES